MKLKNENKIIIQILFWVQVYANAHLNNLLKIELVFNYIFDEVVKAIQEHSFEINKSCRIS